MNKSSRAQTGGVERRAYAARFEVRAAPNGTGGTSYDLEGYASVYEASYEMYDWYGPYAEVVRDSAGKKTLSENPDVVFVLNHEGMPMARTKPGSLLLSEDSHGLHMRAPSLNGDRAIVREVISAVEENILDEMSFAFRVMRQQWSPDYDQRDILEYSLHRGDVSVVTYGANPATSMALRSADVDRIDPEAARALIARLQRRVDVASEDLQRGYPLSLAEAEAHALLLG